MQAGWVLLLSFFSVKNYVLTKLSILAKLGRLRAAITWFPATWGELTVLVRATLSAAVELLTLSTSEADDDGDSPDK